MAERIYKLQPNRTMALRGFDNLGASASMHSATATSFKVSGNFREASDFCVLILWDVDNFYEHPLIKYLPDPNFAGLTLTFDVQYTGLQPLDSTKYPTIDWPYLDYIKFDETTGKTPLFANHTQVGGTYTAASTTFTIVDNGLQSYDRVTLWYQNFAFDYIVPAPPAGGPATVTATDVAAALATYINKANYGQMPALTAASNQNQLTVTAAQPGTDGNLIQLYQINKNNNLLIDPPAASLTGGDSSAIWRLTLDFTALGFTSVRKMWLTFAPPLAAGEAYPGGDWEASFSNWTLTGPENVKMLQVAGLNSVRVEQTNAACSYSGTWNQISTSFYDRGFANRASTLNSTARIHYSSAVPHDLYIGTLLSLHAGKVAIQLDGDVQSFLSCALGNDDVVVARRKIRSNVPAGEHVVTIVLTLGQYFDFNFLEAAVASDMRAPIPPRANLSPALDFDTDHTYKLPPARILWILDQLGFQAPINEYLGVFWWNQRKAVGGNVPSCTFTFGGTWADGESIFIDIGAPLAGNPSRIDRSLAFSTISKSVFPADTSDSIAGHFAAYINGGFSGIWASASGPNFTLTLRSASYAFAVEVSTSTQTTAGTIAPQNGALNGGTLPDWYVDPSQTPTLNTGARAWHADFYSLCKARGTDVTTAISMELVNPPSTFPARFHDGTAVSTATGFGTYTSMHCAIGGPVLAFQQAVLSDLATLQEAAGLSPCLQMGEFLWWFFTQPNAATASMAYYDDGTIAAARAALGRDLYFFGTPSDDPTVNNSADALFLRNRLRDHVAALVSGVKAAHPTARFEVLLPLDVNYPVLVGPAGAQVGGRLNNFINIPTEWRAQSTAGFDYLKIEALSFGSTIRSLALSRSAIDFMPSSAWPGANRRYLVPVFGTSSPWQKETLLALAAGYGVVNFWALDHICLYGWNISTEAFKAIARSSYQR